jgi:hypothetical protein
MTETETKWSERVREWKASGQTAKAFALGREFKPPTLTYWAFRLRHVSSQQPTAATAAERPMRSGTASQVRVLRVLPSRIHEQSPTAEGTVGVGASAATLMITVGAARIEVRSGFDPALLTEVIEAPGGAR